jgi:chorismate mutase
MSTITESTELSGLRAAIDDVDRRLVELMAERLRLADQTLAAKRRLGLQAVDVRREATVVARGARLAREHGLEPELVRDIFWRLIELSRVSQRAAGAERGTP